MQSLNAPAFFMYSVCSKHIIEIPVVNDDDDDDNDVLIKFECCVVLRLARMVIRLATRGRRLPCCHWVQLTSECSSWVVEQPVPAFQPLEVQTCTAFRDRNPSLVSLCDDTRVAGSVDILFICFITTHS